jgi:hypothetical protein
LAQHLHSNCSLAHPDNASFIQAINVDPNHSDFTQAQTKQIGDVAPHHAAKLRNTSEQMAVNVHRGGPFYESAQQSEMLRRYYYLYPTKPHSEPLRRIMDNPNAFIGRLTKPPAAELATVLGPTFTLWVELVDSITEELGITEQEWNSLKPKYGWALILKVKKRRIVYLGPCAGYFRVSMILGDKAMAAAHATRLPKSIVKLMNEATRYSEGTGLYFTIKGRKDLPAIRKLAQIKLAN